MILSVSRGRVAAAVFRKVVQGMDVSQTVFMDGLKMDSRAGYGVAGPNAEVRSSGCGSVVVEELSAQWKVTGSFCFHTDSRSSLETLQSRTMSTRYHPQVYVINDLLLGLAHQDIWVQLG